MQQPKESSNTLLFPSLEHQLGEEYRLSPAGGIYTFFQSVNTGRRQWRHDQMGDFFYRFRDTIQDVLARDYIVHAATTNSAMSSQTLFTILGHYLTWDRDSKFGKHCSSLVLSPSLKASNL